MACNCGQYVVGDLYKLIKGHDSISTPGGHLASVSIDNVPLAAVCLGRSVWDVCFMLPRVMITLWARSNADNYFVHLACNGVINAQPTV